jgi:hypothetical protein
MTPADAMRDAMLAVLGVAPDVIVPGRFIRFPTNGRRGDVAWCKLFDDERGGVFGCYRQGSSEVWTATDRAMLTRQRATASSRSLLLPRLVTTPPASGSLKCAAPASNSFSKPTRRLIVPMQNLPASFAPASPSCGGRYEH